MYKLRKFFSTVGQIYNPIELVLLTVVLFGANYYYFHIISNNVWVSIFVGLIGLIFFFYHFSYKTKQLENYQEQLNDLLKYVTNIKFFLEIGENVLYSLTSTLPTMTNRYVRKDLQLVIDKLEKDAILQTDHFKKYEFPSLDQFHQNLAICYEHGGNVKEMFDPIQKSMMFELEKRDELYKRRKGFAMNFYFLLGLVAVIPLILNFMVSDLWELFLESPLSIPVLLFSHFVSLFLLYKVQKHKMDISVKL